MSTRCYYIYILSSFQRTIYIGMTNNLSLRLAQHREQKIAGFTARYNVTQLVYYETFENVKEAIAREKEIKKWSRSKKERLIEALNPFWKDLTEQLNN
jgi:putative endonuclease